jgi:hypothetical protein
MLQPRRPPELRGQRIFASRPNRTYPAGRECAADGCDTRLSIHNASSFCWQHEPARIRMPRGQRKKQYAAQPCPGLGVLEADVLCTWRKGVLRWA